MVETLSKEQLDSSSYPSFSSSAETTLTGSDDWSKYYSIPRKVSTALSDECLILNQDGVVDFAYASPAHPRRWRISRKLYDTAVICTFECVTTIISNAGSSIADAVSSDTGVSRELAIFCLATVYLLGQAIDISSCHGSLRQQTDLYIFRSSLRCTLLDDRPGSIARNHRHGKVFLRLAIGYADLRCHRQSGKHVGFSSSHLGHCNVGICRYIRHGDRSALRHRHQ